MDDNQIGGLASLHHSVMHTLLSDLGLPFVSRYYEAARREDSVAGICALEPASEQVIGWAVGSPDPGVLFAKLREPFSWFLVQMLKLAITHPLVSMQLVSSLLSAGRAVEVSEDGIELTYIGVSPAWQGKGLGKSLMTKFIDLSRSKGYDLVVLSVEEENRTATALYEKFNFKIVASFTEGRYRRHRMELRI